MAETPFKKVESREILGADITVLQDVANRVERVLQFGTATVVGHQLIGAVDQLSPSLHCRVYEGSIRNWLETPEPVIRRNGAIVHRLEYDLYAAQGAIVFGDQQSMNDVITADFTCVSNSSPFTGHTGRTDNPHSVTAAQVGAVNRSGDTMTGNLTVPRVFYGNQSFNTVWMPSGTDLNIITVSDRYACENFVNRPPGITGWAFLEHFQHTNNALWSKQIISGYENESEVYIRFSRDVNHVRTWTPWRRIWHSANDGIGSGLDADLVHGQLPAITPTASAVVLRDASGRAQVSAPSVAADIARLDTVTANVATHADLTTAHGSVGAVMGLDSPVTVDPATVPTGNTGGLRAMLGGLANRIRAATGTTNWWDTPATTLASAHTHHGATTSVHGILDAAGMLNHRGTAATDLPPMSAEQLTSAGWTPGTGWTGGFATGFIRQAGVGTQTLSHTLAGVAGTFYQIAYTVIGRTAGTFTIAFGGLTSAALSATGTWGPGAIGTGVFTVTPTSDFNGTIVFSVRIITGVSTPVAVWRDSANTIRSEMRINPTSGNTSFGTIAGGRLTTGSSNSSFGVGAGSAITTGISNSSFGVGAGGAITTGHENTNLGWFAGVNLTTGGANTCIGVSAGRFLADGVTANATSVTCVYVGGMNRASTAGVANEIAIGHSAHGGGTNTVRLGNASVTAWLPGANNTVFLGSSTLGFRELFLSEGATVYRLRVVSGVLTLTAV